MSVQSPKYEVWGNHFDQLSFIDGGNGQHLEDCLTYEDAIDSCKEFQRHQYAAWVQDKTTGEIMPLPLSLI